MIGGLRDGGLADSKLSEIVGKIKPILEEKSGKKFERMDAIGHKKQVVAGTNHFVKVSSDTHNSYTFYCIDLPRLTIFIQSL